MDNNHNHSHNQNHNGQSEPSQISSVSINDASTTALAAVNDEGLRCPCYCEENVWRLTYRKLYGTTTLFPSKDPDSKEEKEHKDNDTPEKHGKQIHTQQKDNKDENEYYVLFVSNDQKSCPFLYQKAKENPYEPCFWDYHVLLMSVSIRSSTDKSIAKHSTAAYIWDIDSYLPYPCPLQQYLNATFHYKLQFIQEPYRSTYLPKFRVIPAKLYLHYFYSDRRHMYNADTNTWHAPPPTYDCIMNGYDHFISNQKSENHNMDNEASIHANTSNLNDYIDMKSKSSHSPSSSSSCNTSSYVDDKQQQQQLKENIMGTVFTLNELEKYFLEKNHSII